MAVIKSKAQSWSIDVTLGVIIFIIAFLVFYMLLGSNSNKKATNLKEEASLVVKQVTAEGSIIKIIDGNEVNLTKVNELKNLSYSELKKRLRIEGDFCIYLEDEKGDIVLINDSYKGLGSSKINLSGTPCSQK